MSESPIIEKALAAVRGDDPEAAREALLEALREHPDRLDLVHSLIIMELQVGNAAQALELSQQSAQLAQERKGPQDLELLPQLLLAQGAAYEELKQPHQAVAAYDGVLQADENHPLATQGKGHLFLAWGRLEEGIAVLQQAVDAAVDDPRFLEATEKLISGVRSFITDDVHPKNFIEAHQGSYVEFFNHHAEKTAADGWIAEAARMKRDEDGNLTPIVIEGARPYAATRVDLVEPSTGQAGLVGDQPMVVAIANHEILAQTPIVSDWPGTDFPVWVSSQCPWNLLNITIVFDDGDASEQADPTIGDWYTAGYEGEFGTVEQGRFHSISDPLPLGEHGVRYDLDCGRADARSIEDLIKRLSVLHSMHPIAGLLIGRGFIPIS